MRIVLCKFKKKTNKSTLLKELLYLCYYAIFFGTKNVGEKRGDLNISSESEVFKVTKELKDGVLSLLSTLEFYEAANNLRTRYVYEKGGVKFEIDDYIRPQMKVVAIEGEKEEVDKVYNELLNVISKENE